MMAGYYWLGLALAVRACVFFEKEGKKKEEKHEKLELICIYKLKTIIMIQTMCLIVC